MTHFGIGKMHRVGNRLVRECESYSYRHVNLVIVVIENGHEM
jgi:hypothetical protein